MCVAAKNWCKSLPSPPPQALAGCRVKDVKRDAAVTLYFPLCCSKDSEERCELVLFNRESLLLERNSVGPKIQPTSSTCHSLEEIFPALLCKLAIKLTGPQCMAEIRGSRFFAFLSSCRSCWAKDWCFGVTQGFGSLKTEGWSLWGITADVLSEFRCFLSVWGKEKIFKKNYGHQNVILKTNTSVFSCFSLPLKSRHWPFVLFILCL